MNKKYYTIFFLFIKIYGNFCLCFAEQQLPKDESSIAKYNFLLDVGSAKKNAEEPTYDNGRLLSSFFCMKCDTINHTLANIEKLQFEEEQQMQELGIDFRAKYSNYLFNDEESIEKNNIQLGINWKLLGDGLVSHRRMAHEIALKRNIEELTSNRLNELYPCHDTMMMYWFGRQKLAMLKQQIKILELYVEAFRAAYLQGAVFADDFFKAEYALRKNIATARNLEKQEDMMKKDSTDILPPQMPVPLLDINIENILTEFNADKKNDTLVRLERELAHSKKDILNKIKFDLSFDTVRNFPVQDKTNEYELRFGALLSFPLTGYENRAATLANEREITSRYARDKNDKRLDILMIYNRYEEKLYDAVLMKFRRKIVEERLRRAIFALKYKDSSIPIEDTVLISLAKQLIEIIDIDFETLSVKESLYRDILHLFIKADMRFNSAYIEKPHIDSDKNRARTGERWVYIWSEEFNNNENEAIFDFIQTKGIKHILLSAGEKTSQSKLTEFIASASKTDITVELMLSNNNWIFPDRLENAVENIEKFWGIVPDIHLDIEPHVLNECKSSSQMCWQYYLTMIKRFVKIKNSKQHLSISLPTSTPDDILQELYLIVDMIHIMAYGKTDTDSIQKKIAKFKFIGAEKLSLALRPKDFNNEYAMETFIDKMNNSTGIQNFSIHDMKQYKDICIKIDK